MFTNKAQVDKFVQTKLRNCADEKERNRNSYRIARLYADCGEYEIARKYVSSYLNETPSSAVAHRLLARCLEKLGLRAAALRSYQSSLELDPDQKDILLKVCELMCSEDVPLDPQRADYWIERTQKHYPNNPVLFSLRERTITENGVETDGDEIEKLIASELEKNPTDAGLHVRLLQQLLYKNKLSSAYRHAREIESVGSDVFGEDLAWYATVANVSARYACENSNTEMLDADFWMFTVSTHDRLTSLTLAADVGASLSKCAAHVSELDRALASAVENAATGDRYVSREFAKHFGAQLCFHMATFLLKKAKAGKITYKEAKQACIPLLTLAWTSVPPETHSVAAADCTDQVRKKISRWRIDGAFRCSQAGRVLLSMLDGERSNFSDRMVQLCNGDWRKRVFEKVFASQPMSSLATSHFYRFVDFSDPRPILPTRSELLRYDVDAQLYVPASLHNLVWIALDSDLSELKLAVFPSLQYSVANLSNCGAETVNSLDVRSFVYATVFCAESRKNQPSRNDCPGVVPASIADPLCTPVQEEWYRAVRRVYANRCGLDLGSLRMTLTRGIEVLRAIGNHGMRVELLVRLAKTFCKYSKNLVDETEREFAETRAALYWNNAVPALDRLKNGHAIKYGLNKYRLFDYVGPEPSRQEIEEWLEDGKVYLALRLKAKKEYDRALELLSDLRGPYASFYSAEIYEELASVIVGNGGENVTSEMRSQHVIMLSKARSCVYATLDRLRSPALGNGRDHPLDAVLGPKIEEIESRLARFDSDAIDDHCDYRRRDVSNASSADSVQEHAASRHTSRYLYGGAETPKNKSQKYLGQSTPFARSGGHEPYRNGTDVRYESFERRTEARPSPERLDAQLRRIVTVVYGVQQTAEHLLTRVEHLSARIEENFNTMTRAIQDLKKNVADNDDNVKREIAELRKEFEAFSKVKSTQLNDEDLYVLDDDYDYGATIASAQTAFGQSTLYPAAGRAPAVPLAYHTPSLYPNVYPGMYGYAGLPLQAFAEPDFRAVGSLGQQQTAARVQGLAPVPGLTTPALTQNLGHVLQQTLSQPVQPIPQVAAQVLPRPLPPQAYGVGRPASISPSTTTALSAKPSLPINVVITASDPVPSATTKPAQILSVTIPPQHLKANSSRAQVTVEPVESPADSKPAAGEPLKTSAQSPAVPPISRPTTKSQDFPHNYQIPLPASSRLNFVPTFANTSSPLPISTANLLSDVASPVYSALGDRSSSSLISSDGAFRTADSVLSADNAFLSAHETSDTIVNEEHDPCPDFKPIVPLPDEIEVKTGEEGETVVYKERAKLYRYVDKEWRERGVGDLKLLKCDCTGKIRLLMRRDQVHKICANHFLSPDMELQPMTTSDRAFVWAANDYADEEMRVEKLCIRFKTPEQANRFKKVFDDAKAEIVKLAASSSPQKIETLAAVPKESKLVPKESKAVLKESTLNKQNASDEPPKVVERQRVLKAPQKPADKPNPLAAFSFSATKFVAERPGEVGNVDFNSLVGILEKQLNTVVKPEQKTVEPPSEKEDDPVEFVPTQEFVPVVPLPELADVKTGEEEEKVLFGERAKLLAFDSVNKQWKERGVGAMKILQSGILRLLMRRDQVLKVCCNHRVTKTMEFAQVANVDRAVRWAAQDYSENEAKSEVFTAKFESADNARRFIDTIKSAQEKMDAGNFIEEPATETAEEPVIVTPPRLAWGDKFKPKTGSWECTSCYLRNDSKDCRCTACGDAKPDAGQKKDSDGPAAVSGWGDKFKPKVGSWECKSCYINNEAANDYCVACESPKDDTVPKRDPKTKGLDLFDPNAPKFSFGIPSTAQPAPKFTFGIPAAEPAASKFTFGAETKTEAQQTPQKFSFGSPSVSAFTPKSGFVFGAAPETAAGYVFGQTETPVFGSPVKYEFAFTPRASRRSTEGGDESDGNASEDEGEHIHFSPIVPLPEKIDAKTGEENEEILYSRRAKLFRFVDAEWKERGVGTLKILKHRDSGKVRVLMRRDQVLKLCMNHALTSEIEYWVKDDRSWLFGAPDFSDGEIKHEKFCVRFETAQIASEFKAAIDAAKVGSRTPSKAKESAESDLEVVYELTVTPEKKELAEKLQLPANFYAYENKEPCPGCVGCDSENYVFRSGVKKDAKDTPKKDKSGKKASQHESPSKDKKKSEKNKSAEQKSKSRESGGDETEKQTPKKVVEKAKETGERRKGSEKQKEVQKHDSLEESGEPEKSETVVSGQSFGVSSRGSIFSMPGTKIFGDTLKSSGGNLNFGDSKVTFSFGQTNVKPAFETQKTDESESAVGKTSVLKPSLFGAPAAIEPKSIFGGAPVFLPETSIFPITKSETSIFPVTKSEKSPFTAPKSESKPDVSIFAMPKTESTNIFSGAPKLGHALPFGTAKTDDKKDVKFDFASLGKSAAPFDTTDQTFGLSANRATFGEIDKPSDEKQTEPKLKDFGIDFATLAKSGTIAAFSNANPQSIFQDAGAPVFSRLSKNVTPKADDNKNADRSRAEGDDTVENVEDAEYDPHYEPIVPLPAKIEVRTGEENETVEFCSRAKLYRYDGAAKEWKERGVGEIKLLRGDDSWRLLMRRDQVHKVVLNERVRTDGPKLKPMNSSDRAFCWWAQNYTDESAVTNSTSYEYLAVKFKDSELAAHFLSAVDRAKEAVTEKTREIDPASVVRVSGEEPADEGSEENDDDYEDYDEDEDDEKSMMFARQCVLFLKSSDGFWTELGRGDVNIYYDSEIYGARIYMETDEGETVLNSTIGSNTVMKNHGTECTWSSVNCVPVDPIRQDFRAVFSDADSAEQFHAAYLEGLQCAQASDIVDADPLEYGSVNEA